MRTARFPSSKRGRGGWGYGQAIIIFYGLMLLLKFPGTDRGQMRTYVTDYHYTRQLFYTFSDKKEIELPISDWLDGLQKTVRASIQKQTKEQESEGK